MIKLGLIKGMQGFFNIHKSINVTHYINKLKNEKNMITSIDAEKALHRLDKPGLIPVYDLFNMSLNSVC